MQYVLCLIVWVRESREMKNFFLLKLISILKASENVPYITYIIGRYSHLNFAPSRL